MNLDSSVPALLDALVEQIAERVTAKLELPATHPTPPRDDRPRLLTIAQAAEEMNLSQASVRRLIESNKLRVVRCFSALRVDVRDIDEWVERAKELKR